MMIFELALRGNLHFVRVFLYHGTKVRQPAFKNQRSSPALAPVGSAKGRSEVFSPYGSLLCTALNGIVATSSFDLDIVLICKQLL